MYIWLSGWILLANTMRQSLIQIEDDCLFQMRLCERQFNHSVLDLLGIYRVHVLQKVYWLKNVDGELAKHGPFEFPMLQRWLIIHLAVHMLFLSLDIVVSQNVVGHGGRKGGDQGV